MRSTVRLSSLSLELLALARLAIAEAEGEYRRGRGRGRRTASPARRRAARTQTPTQALTPAEPQHEHGKPLGRTGCDAASARPYSGARARSRRSLRSSPYDTSGPAGGKRAAGHSGMGFSAAAGKIAAMNRRDIDEFFRRLAQERPDPRSELDYINPYTLLVAVVLSAQATDAGVNKATAPLFKRRRHAGRRCWRWARTGCATTSRPSASSTPRPRTSSR